MSKTITTISSIVFTLIILVIVSTGLCNKFKVETIHYVARLMRHSLSRGVTSQLIHLKQKHVGVCRTLMLKNGAQQQRK